MSNSNNKHPSTAPGAPAPKRMRVSRACEQCRSRKAKCDGSQPTCSTCGSLGQTCSYGPPPKKRGLPPGSFSMLERTVKLFEKLLGMLFINVPGSDDVLLSLVQTCGKSLMDDGQEGEALTKAWKEGSVIKALEVLQASASANAEANTAKKPVRKSISSGSPGLETAQRLFKDASKTIPKPKEGTPQAGNFADGNHQDAAFGDRLDGIDWMGEMPQSADAADYDTGQSDQRNGEGDEEEFSNSPPITIDPLLMNTTTGFPPVLDPPTAQNQVPNLSPSVQQIPLAPNTAHATLTQPHPQPALLPQVSHGEKATQQHSLSLARSKPDFPSNSKSLLDLYFTYTHSWFPILDKYDIIRLFHAYNDLTASREHSEEPSSDGKRALLYAVLAVASLQRESLPSKSRQEADFVSDTSDLYIRSQTILFSPGHPVSLQTVQALLLLSLVNISQDQLSSAWLLIGLAGRIAIDLGLDDPTSHLRVTSRFALRAWLGFIVLEVFISHKLKREPQLSGVEWPLAGLEADGWEEWDSWKDVPLATTSRDDDEDNLMGDDGRPAHILSVFNQLIALSGHVYDISHAKGVQKGQHSKSKTHNVFVDLQSWIRALPENCALDPSHPNKPQSLQPHVLNLHAFYMHTVIEAHFSPVPQGSARSHHPTVSAAGSSTLGWIDQFKTKRSLAVAPCMFLSYAEELTSSPCAEEIDSSTLDRALVLADEMKSNWRTSKPNDNKCLLRAIEEKASAGPQDWFEAQLGPMGASVDIVRPLDGGPISTIMARSHATDTTSPFSPSNLFSSGMPPPKVAGNLQTSVPSPSALFNLPPSSARSQEQQRPSPLYEDSSRMIGAQSSPSAIGIPTNLSQTAPSPDTFDEEMGMLECLPWAQEGIPEFIQNLGYVAGFSPTALQMNVAPEEQQQSRRHAAMPSFLANAAAVDSGDDPAFSRHGLNTVLERWLGDVYGTGNGR